MDGFLNVDQCVIVADWESFVEWANDGGGYDQSYFNVRDSKCLALQEDYIAYLAETQAGAQA